MQSHNSAAQRVDRAALVAFASAAMFGFGPVAVGYFAQIANLSSFSENLRATTLYFLAVYLVVAGLGASLRVKRLNLVALWTALPRRGRTYAVLAGLSNAISGWCFFDMLGRIDPLSAAVIMALAIVFNLFASRLLLGEEIRLRSTEGRRKWGAFLLILAGVVLTSLYSYLRSGQTAGRRVTVLTLLIAFASSLFSALRTVSVKGTMNDFPGSAGMGIRLDLPLAVTRLTYLVAFAVTLVCGVIAAAADRSSPMSLRQILLPNAFLPVLGVVYGAAYALNYIAMSRIEASRMALITRSAIVFTAGYMVVFALVFHYGVLPSAVQAPAALLVMLGSYLAARR